MAQPLITLLTYFASGFTVSSRSRMPSISWFATLQFATYTPKQDGDLATCRLPDLATKHRQRYHSLRKILTKVSRTSHHRSLSRGADRFSTLQQVSFGPFPTHISPNWEPPSRDESTLSSSITVSAETPILSSAAYGLN